MLSAMELDNCAQCHGIGPLCSVPWNWTTVLSAMELDNCAQCHGIGQLCSVPWNWTTVLSAMELDNCAQCHAMELSPDNFYKVENETR